MLRHLLGGAIGRCEESITLAVDCRVSTSTDGVHFPMGVVVVHHMEVAVSASGHALHKPFPKMVEGNCYLHLNVLCIIVVVAQEHDLIMVRHKVV